LIHRAVVAPPQAAHWQQQQLGRVLLGLIASAVLCLLTMILSLLFEWQYNGEGGISLEAYISTESPWKQKVNLNISQLHLHKIGTQDIFVTLCVQRTISLISACSFDWWLMLVCSEGKILLAD
jgi:hypothetical protein